MANALDRVIHSVFSSIFYCCNYQGDKRERRAYYHTAIPSLSNTFYHAEGRNGYGPRMGKKGRSLSLQTVELKVRMCCTGCERVVKHAISKIRGVDSVEVNLGMNKVTVTGYVDRNKVLKKVRRSGKKAEFWPNPAPPLYFTSTKNYFRNEESYRESYNYWRHGYNGDKHGHIPAPPRGADRVSNMFNDDNVNACQIM